MEFLVVIVLVYLAVVAWSQVKRKGRKMPPGPYPLPIVGNIFQVDSSNIHKSFAQLSKKYGPLMSLQLGGTSSVVISSPEVSRETMTMRGSSNRASLQAFNAHDHLKFSVGFLPVDSPKWKHMRKICQEQMFTNHSLGKSQWLRHKKLQQLIDYVQNCCDAGRAVNIRDAAFTTTLNLMSATLFTDDAVEFDSKTVAELKDVMTAILAVISTPNFADFFPILRFLDPQGLRKLADRQFGRLLSLIKNQIDQRLESRRANSSHHHNDFLETLLDVSSTPDSGYDLTIDDIAHLLFDLYFAGSDSTMVAIEWVMTELMQHPDVLSKAKEELRNVIGDRKMIDEAEIPSLPYLGAVIKESFRLRPAVPLLSPRKAIEDMEINGYFIPKDTTIILNAWAISRDPSVWPNPESFEPQRFLNNNIDYKGQSSQLTPFGSGRRICPGLPLAHRTLFTVVATLIHNFDWKFAEGESKRNKEVLVGGSLHRESPLMVIPLKP
nr:cytochrome P450 [Isodon lophanthoides var. gerardianus]